jgi:hypothetical protein
MSIVFFSYSHADETVRDQLEIHLTMLKRRGLISAWHDRRIVAGEHLDNEIDQNLERADVILLLLSPDFLASEYCYSREMKRALELHRSGKARTIAVILRPCEWQQAELSQFLVTPTDGKPVTKWADRDEAFLDITRSIRRAVEGRTRTQAQPSPVLSGAELSVTIRRQGPRSSNLRLRKEFTEHDQDSFLDEAFEFIANFFENSLQELKARNPGHETRFKRVDANKFTAAIYRDGNALSRCQIRLGGGFGKGIPYSQGEA